RSARAVRRARGDNRRRLTDSQGSRQDARATPRHYASKSNSEDGGQRSQRTGIFKEAAHGFKDACPLTST
ncbi:MAG: hypothetical protein ACKPKO_29930, partial [Candidatus Fonsibacter sp.]